MKGIHSSDCKHKHTWKNGAPPDKSGVLYRLLHTEFHGFNKFLFFNIMILFFRLDRHTVILHIPVVCPTVGGPYPMS